MAIIVEPGAANKISILGFSFSLIEAISSSLVFSSLSIASASACLLNLFPKLLTVSFNPSKLDNETNSLGILLSVNSFS